MDFARAPGGPATHGPPAKAISPEGPTEEGLPTIPPVLPGPADRSRPASPNPYSVEAPGVGLPGPSLASQLNWMLPWRPRAHRSSPPRVRR
jgi:hypothetical protein